MRNILLIIGMVLSNITFAQPTDRFEDIDDVFNFEVPQGLFQQISNTKFSSLKLNATIEFNYESEYIGVENPNADINVAFRNAKKGLNTKYQVLNKNKFTVSGLDKLGNIVYIKGVSDSLISKNGCDDCIPVWMWTKTIIIIIKYPPSSKVEMDRVLSTFLKTLKIVPALI